MTCKGVGGAGEAGPPKAVISGKSSTKGIFRPILQGGIGVEALLSLSFTRELGCHTLTPTVSVKGPQVGPEAPTSPATKASDRQGLWEEVEQGIARSDLGDWVTGGEGKGKGKGEAPFRLPARVMRSQGTSL